MTENVEIKSVEDVKKKTKNKKRRKASLEKKKARAGWIFVLPFVIGFLLVYLPIIYRSLFTSLTFRASNNGVVTYTFQGWKVYAEALRYQAKNQTFLRVLFEGVADLILDIPMILLFSLFMAVLLNQKMAGRAAFRAILFVPVIISTGVMHSISSGAMSDYMSSSSGINDGSGQDSATEIVSALDVQKLFSGMAIGEGMLKYVTDTINRIYDIVNRSGVQMLIFLAGLQSISPAIYESVQIDGATAWETFWKITFPMISPMILVNAVYTIIDAFTTQGAQIMSFIEDVQSPNSKAFNTAALQTAMSWIYFLVVIAIIALVAAICSAYVFYQKKK